MVGMGELTGSIVALLGTWLASIPPFAGNDEPVRFIELFRQRHSAEWMRWMNLSIYWSLLLMLDMLSC